MRNPNRIRKEANSYFGGKIMKKKSKKLISLLLTALMLAAMLPLSSPPGGAPARADGTVSDPDMFVDPNQKKPVDADTYNELNLNVTAPDPGEGDPYGDKTGKIALTDILEIGMFVQDNDDANRDYSVFKASPRETANGEFRGETAAWLYGKSAASESHERPVTVAADLYATGQKNCVITMTADGNTTSNGNISLRVDETDPADSLKLQTPVYQSITGVQFLSYPDSSGATKYIQYEFGIEPWMAEGVYQIAAGNFDGEPGDELAIYVPRLTDSGIGRSRVLIYKFDTDAKQFVLWTYFIIPDGFHVTGNKGSTQAAVESLPVLTMSTGDVTMDGRSDLLISVSASHLNDA